MSVKNLSTGNALVRAVTEKLALSGCFHFYAGPDQRIRFTIDLDKIPHGYEGFLGEMAELGTSALLEVSLQGHALHEGLKVVTLNQLDAEALEHTTLNFPACEYNQPFPTMFVDLPESFFQNHEVSCPQEGEIFAGLKNPGRHYPHCVGLRHYKDDEINYLIASVYFTSKQAFTLFLDTSVHSGTLEESIQHSREPGRQLQNSTYNTPEEEEVTLAALRVALNTVLILEGEGMKLLGPANPKYYRQLEENVRKARKRRDPDEKLQKAEQILRVEPIYYAFDQNVVIYQREDAHDHGDGFHEPTGRTMRPHWRAGHYRMQRHGVGNLQCKRIRIPSVLVNKQKFVGQLKDTSVTYQVRK